MPYCALIFFAGSDDFHAAARFSRDRLASDDSAACKDLGLLEAVEYHKLAEKTTEIKRMLTALIQKLNAESLRSALWGRL
jgi:hypothetical protein